MPPLEIVENDSAAGQLCMTDLPNEILSQIFHAGTQSWSESRTRAQELPFPLLVSNVCAHWRLLAQSTPELWSFIVPPLHKDEDLCISETVEWLGRCGSLPVSVVLDVRHGSEGLLEERSTLLRKVFLRITEKEISRLRRLDIYDFDSISLEPHLRNLCDAINMVQFSFYIFVNRPSIIGDDSEDWEWSLKLPSLRKLGIRGLWFPYIRNLISLTVANFALTYSKAEALFSASNITTLAFEIGAMTHLPPPPNRPPINAPSLRSLAVRYNRADKDGNYLSAWLSLPNLVHLELDGTLAMSISLCFGASFSGAKIETLRISNCGQHGFPSGVTDADLRIFHSFTGLRHLQIIQAPAARILFSKLLNAPNSPGSWSRTRTRSIHLPRPPTVRDHGGFHINDPRFLQQQLEEMTASPKDAFDRTAQVDIIPWPDLRIMSLDALPAADVALLCEFVGRHKGVQTVELSKPCMRHLSESLRRHGEKINPLPWRAGAAEIGYSDGTKDVQEWLAARVHLALLPASDHGLLDGDRFYEMI